MKRSIKNYINYALELFLLISTLGIVISSYIVWFVLPRGIGMHGSIFCGQLGHGQLGNAYTVFGWPRYMWIEIHNWMGVVLAAIILVHIVLHWKWIVETTRRVRSYIRGQMTRVKELYITAVISFILFSFEVFSGCVIWLILPRGRFDYYSMTAGYGRTFWGLQRNVWADLHGWVAVTILAIFIIHVILNWKWVVAVSKNTYHGISGAFLKALPKRKPEA